MTLTFAGGDEILTRAVMEPNGLISDAFDFEGVVDTAARVAIATRTAQPVLGVRTA